MAEKKEVQHLISLNTLDILHTAPGKYTVPAGTRFELVSSSKVIVVDIDCHFKCDVEAEQSSLLKALKKAFKDQHFKVIVEQGNLSADKKNVDINISIIGESQVTYQDIYDAVSKHLGSSYILRKGRVKQFIGDITELDFSNDLTVPTGTVFQTYQQGSVMSFTTHQDATFHRISDTGTCVYSLTKNVNFRDTSKSIAIRIICCFEIDDDHLHANNINTQIQQHLQEHKPFNCYVSVFTFTNFNRWDHDYDPRGYTPNSVGLSVLIRNIPDTSNQDIAIFLQEYLGHNYIVAF